MPLKSCNAATGSVARITLSGWPASYFHLFTSMSPTTLQLCSAGSSTSPRSLVSSDGSWLRSLTWGSMLGLKRKGTPEMVSPNIASTFEPRKTDLTGNIDIPYRSPFQPFTAWATLILVLCVIIFSGERLKELSVRWRDLTVAGFDVFVKGHFTIDEFLTCYLNIAIFTGMWFIILIIWRRR